MSDFRHPLVRLALEAIQAFVLEQRTIDPPESLFTEVPTARERAGAFVCLKLGGQLRGCIGTTEPTQATLATEVIQSAIGAATRDPRFPAIYHAELEELAVSVDVLGVPERILDFSELDHRRYGVIVQSGTRHGVLLPDIEGIDSVADQVAQVLNKAGVDPGEGAQYFRFVVTRYR